MKALVRRRERETEAGCQADDVLAGSAPSVTAVSHRITADLGEHSEDRTVHFPPSLLGMYGSWEQLKTIPTLLFPHTNLDARSLT